MIVLYNPKATGPPTGAFRSRRFPSPRCSKAGKSTRSWMGTLILSPEDACHVDAGEACRVAGGHGNARSSNQERCRDPAGTPRPLSRKCLRSGADTSRATTPRRRSMRPMSILPCAARVKILSRNSWRRFVESAASRAFWGFPIRTGTAITTTTPSAFEEPRIRFPGFPTTASRGEVPAAHLSRQTDSRSPSEHRMPIQLQFLWRGDFFREPGEGGTARADGKHASAPGGEIPCGRGAILRQQLLPDGGRCAGIG